MKIRVAHVIQNLNYGGMERVLHDLAQQLPRHGFEIHIVVLEYYGRFAQGLGSGVTLHQVAPMSRSSFFHPGGLIEVLREIAPDVSHSHTGLWFKAARAARLAGVPATVHTEHGRPDPVPLSDRLIDNAASRWTDVVVAVSDALAGVLRQQVVHDPRRVRVITNGVDTGRFRPPEDRSELRRELEIPVETSVIGSIGRLEPVKNYGLALRAFARLNERWQGSAPPLLVLAGDGSERGSLEELAKNLGILPRVKFLGWREDAERLYAALDLFTLTSRSEGTSVSLLEAMSTGVCPTVTDVGGNRAVLGAELGSLLVPDQDEASLVASWERLLLDPGLRADLGAQARRRVVSAFSLERMVEQYATVYRGLVQRNERAGGAGKPAPSRMWKASGRRVAKQLVERALRVTLGNPGRMRGRALILTYHNVVPDATVGLGDRSLHLPVSRFLRQIDLLQTHCQIVSLAEVLSAETSSDTPRVAITFDDAYRGAVEHALPELARRGLPSSLFVSPGLLGVRSFWWDEMAAGSDGLPVDLRRIALEKLAGRDHLIRAGLRPKLVARDLPEWFGCASEAQLRALGELGYLMLGAHGWSHPNLARLDPGELEMELSRPLEWLNAVAPAALPTLAYPYGLSTPEVEVAAAKAGYAAALLAEGGWFIPDSGRRWVVPRYNVPAGLSEDGFLLRLSGRLAL